MSNNVSLLEFIRLLPALVWSIMKGLLMGIILIAALALVFFAAYMSLYMLCQFAWWVGPKIVQMPEMARAWLAERKARRISRMVDQEAERQRSEEEVEMLGKGQREGEGRMSGETLRGGEEKGEAN